MSENRCALFSTNKINQLLLMGLMFNRTQLDSKFDFCDVVRGFGHNSDPWQTVGYVSNLITKNTYKGVGIREIQEWTLQ